MLLLATLLSFGWPKPKVEFGPARPVEKGEWLKSVNQCCGSMRPLLHGGEIAHVVAYTGQALVGRIVSNGRALHMVTAETKDAILTTGIANRRSDGWSPKSSIEYVVVYVERGH